MPDDTERYAAGLPRTGRRALTQSEQRWLASRIVGLRWRAAAVVAALGASVGAALGLAAAWPDVVSQLGGTLGVWVGTASAIGTLLALVVGGWPRIPAGLGVLYLAGLAAVGALVPELTQRPHPFTEAVLAAMAVLGLGMLAVAAARAAAVVFGLRKVRTDLANAQVERFGGLVGASSPGALRRLARAGFGGAKQGDRARIDVLPESGLIIRASGRRCPRWVYAHRAEVAATAPHAMRVELPTGVAPTSATTRFELQRRSLSPAERTELDAHIARLRRRPWGAMAATVGLTIRVCWQLGSGWLNDGAWVVVLRLLDPILLGWYAVTTIAVFGYVRRSIAARKLDRDRELRWVVTVHDKGRHGTAPPLEVLPVSQLAWTENAAPAGWRATKI